MKKMLTIICLCVLSNAFAQTAKQDLTKDLQSAERKAILQAIKVAVKPDLKLVPKLVVRKLTVKGGFAFFQGSVKNETGGEIDFRKTAYKEYVESGIFDGDGTTVLLKKTAGGWKALTFTIGPTDVPWGCWWKEFKAPKEIFDYAEESCE